MSVSRETLGWMLKLLEPGQDRIALFCAGSSMWPVIPSCSEVKIRRVDPAGLRAGDIVCRKRSDGSFLIHRLVRIDARGAFITRGDAIMEEDEPCGKSAVKGRVEEVRYGRLRLHADGPIHEFLGRAALACPALLPALAAVKDIARDHVAESLRRIHRLELYRRAAGALVRKNIHVAIAGLGDLEDLRRIYRQGRLRPGVPEDAEVLRGRKPVILMARLGNRPAGAAMLVRMRPPGSRKGPAWHVRSMEVRLPWRGLGIGRMLLCDLVTLAKELGAVEVFLTVRKDNQPAISLYQATGFARIPPAGRGVRPGEIAMRFNLDNAGA